MLSTKSPIEDRPPIALRTRAIVVWIATMTAGTAGCIAGSEALRSVSESPVVSPQSPSPTSPPDPVAALEKSLVFIPTPYPGGNWNPPGLKYEDAWFKSSDGTQLHGWYILHDNPRAVILFCHGNAGNVTHRARTLRTLHDWVGASVLIFDYRGYGKSKGEPNEEGILADARAARAWLAERVGVDSGQIVLLGRSLGGGVAVDLAAADGAKALILESTFTSLPDVAVSHYPLLPAQSLMQTRLNSLSKIAKYHGPLLESHGDADKLVPYKLGRQLYDAANEPKKFLTFPAGGHNDSPPPHYYDAMVDFLDAARKTP